MNTYELTPELVTLLRNSYVRDELSYTETGAAEIDGKRPYGNSLVYLDVAELLGWKVDEDGGLTDKQKQEAMRLHAATPQALQVVLSAGSFEPGTYTNGSKWADFGGHQWSREGA